eukprot:8683453-Alexandrium_andersonii.AAC.1
MWTWQRSRGPCCATATSRAPYPLRALCGVCSQLRAAGPWGRCHCLLGHPGPRPVAGRRGACARRSA